MAHEQTLDFVVDVSGALWCYLLNYVHRRAIVAAQALKMTTEHAVRSPQREDHIATVRVVVVTADAVPLGHGQSVEGHRGRLLPIWDTVTTTVLPQKDRQNDDDQKEDRAASDNPHEQAWLCAITATGVCLSRF